MGERCVCGKIAFIRDKEEDRCYCYDCFRAIKGEKEFKEVCDTEDFCVMYGW